MIDLVHEFWKKILIEKLLESGSLSSTLNSLTTLPYDNIELCIFLNY